MSKKHHLLRLILQWLICSFIIHGCTVHLHVVHITVSTQTFCLCHACATRCCTRKMEFMSNNTVKNINIKHIFIYFSWNPKVTFLFWTKFLFGLLQTALNRCERIDNAFKEVHETSQRSAEEKCGDVTTGFSPRPHLFAAHVDISWCGVLFDSEPEARSASLSMVLSHTNMSPSHPPSLLFCKLYFESRFHVSQMCVYT